MMEEITRVVSYGFGAGAAAGFLIFFSNWGMAIVLKILDKA